MTPEELFKKDQEVMTAVILKAMKNGWVPRLEMPEAQWAYAAGQFSVKAKIWNGEKMVDEISMCSIERIIFDHEFAKALWGEGIIEDSFEDIQLSIRGVEVYGGILSYPYNEGGKVSFCVENWKKQLQELALSYDRLEFLSKFV